MFYILQLLRGKQTHWRRVLKDYFVGSFPSMYEIGVYEFRIGKMIKNYAPWLYVSMTSPIFLKKIQEIYNGFENIKYIFLGYDFIFFTMFLY
jgi:hypothetical protein